MDPLRTAHEKRKKTIVKGYEHVLLEMVLASFTQCSSTKNIGIVFLPEIIHVQITGVELSCTRLILRLQLTVLSFLGIEHENVPAQYYIRLLTEL